MEYFVPGFIFIVVFTYLTSRKVGSYVIIGSVVISYILKAFASLLHANIFATASIHWGNRVLILSTIALILSLCFVYISEQKPINKFFLFVNHKSLHDDIWSDIIDYKNGTTLRITCQDAIYTGVLVGHEEKGVDSWFILEDYITEENDTIYSSENITYNSRLGINLKNVKRIELFYGKEQQTFFEKIKIKLQKEQKDHPIV